MHVLSSLLATQEGNSALRSIFKLHIIILVIILDYFSNRVMGACHVCCSYNCPSLLTALHISVLL
jgi:hypothetical protein